MNKYCMHEVDSYVFPFIPFDFYLRSTLKHKIYSTEVTSRWELAQRIGNVISLKLGSKTLRNFMELL